MRDEEKPSKTYKTKRIRAVPTETETNEQELDLLDFRQEVLDGIDRIAGKGLIRDLEADG